MKRPLVVSVALVCAFAMHGYGEVCNRDIRDGFAAQELDSQFPPDYLEQLAHLHLARIERGVLEVLPGQARDVA